MDRRNFLKTAAILTGTAASSLSLGSFTRAIPSVGAAQPVPPNPTPTVADPEAELLAQGKAAVDAYLSAHNMVMEVESDEYNTFLFSVLNDHHPDLIVPGDIDVVTLYAIRTLKLQPDTETPTAEWARIFMPIINNSITDGGADASVLPPVTTSHPYAQAQPALWVYYDRWMARNYTYNWTAWWGGKSRNPAYPDFPLNDCTNFISQAVRAGGVPMVGNGVCGSENNTSEWYVTKAVAPCSWRWSYSWSVVLNFRYYMRDKIGAYVEAYPANNESLSLLISRIREGDIIQFDTRSCSACAWTPTHTVMVSTKQNKGNYYLNDLTYNDHSGGPNGNDCRDAYLRAKYDSWKSQNLLALRRMVWIRMW